MENKTEPLFSIITPVYKPNMEYFKECAESVINQTYPNWEWLVVDDGNDASTKKEIITFLETCRTSRIKFISLPHSGQSMARNKGLDSSKGDYIIFLDADDLISKTFIEQGLPFVSQDLIVLFGDTDSNNSLAAKIIKDGPLVCAGVKIDNLFFKFGDIDYPSITLRSCWGKIFPKNTIRFINNHPWPGEDTLYVLNNKACVSSFVCFPNFKGYFYRHNSSSTSNSFSKDGFKNFINLFKLLHEYADRQNNSADWHTFFNREIVDIYIYNYFKQFCFNINNSSSKADFLQFIKNDYVRTAIKETKTKMIHDKKKRFILCLLKAKQFRLVYLFLKRRYKHA